MWTRWLSTFALCTVATGCHLVDNAVHDLTYETKLKISEVQENCRYEKLAKASWENVQFAHPETVFPKEYVKGYKEGFVDYLFFGGTGQPPYVPPKCYWGAHYRTPEGYRAIEDWFAGFRHGAAAAQQSGYRQWAKVPSAHSAEPPPAVPVVPAAPIETEPELHAPQIIIESPPPQLSPPVPTVLPESEPKRPTAPPSEPAPTTSLPLLGPPVSQPEAPTILQVNEQKPDRVSRSSAQPELQIVPAGGSCVVEVENHGDTNYVRQAAASVPEPPQILNLPERLVTFGTSNGSSPPTIVPPRP